MALGAMSQVVQHLRRAALLRGGNDPSDGQLLERFLGRGEELAFEALVRRHGPMVFGLCRRLLGNSHDAEDAFQATFLVLARKAGSIRQREAVGSWLYGVAYRTARDARARLARRRAREQQARDKLVKKTEPESSRAELLEALDYELSRLPDKYRLPVVLCELEGRKRKEVAAQLQIPEGTLSSRLATARRMLARRLSRHGFSCTAGVLSLAASAARAEVPAALVTATTKVVAMLGAGQGLAAGAISANVTALTEGVIRAMLLTKLKIATLAVLAVCGFGAGLAFLPFGAGAGQPNRPAPEATAPGVPAPGLAKAVEAKQTERAPNSVIAEAEPDVALKEEPEIAVPGIPQVDKVRKEGTSYTWKERFTLSRNGRGVFGVAFSPDGKIVASGDLDGTVTLWDTATGKQVLWDTATVKQVRLIKAQLAHVRALAFSPDGQRLAVAEWEEPNQGAVSMWQVTSGKLLSVFQAKDAVMSVAFSPDGQTLAVAGADPIVHLCDGTTLKIKMLLRGHGHPVYAVAFSPYGKTLASAGGVLNWDKNDIQPGEVKLWDLASRKERLSKRLPDVASALAFSPSGNLLATGCFDHSGRLLHPRTGKELQLQALFGHKSFVFAVAFHPDGNTLASGSHDETVKLWEVASGKELATLHGHLGMVTSVAFSPDGRLLATGSGTTRFGSSEKGRAEVKIWAFSGGEPLAQEAQRKVRGTVISVGDRKELLVSLDLDQEGIKPGTLLHVYRIKPRPEYLGRVELLNVRQRQAVGRPKPPSLGEIKAGDKVASELPLAETPEKSAPPSDEESATDLPRSWANKLFEETSKDFGSCKRGEQLKHRFKITNVYKVPLDITHVRVSSGNLRYLLSHETLGPKETGYLDVIWDTSRFSGAKTVTIYVRVGSDYISTATLRLSAVAPEGVSLSPGKLNFGMVRRGQSPTLTLDVEYAGPLDWRIVEVIKNLAAPFLVSIEETDRQKALAGAPGRAGYRLTVTLKPDAATGRFKQELTLKTNDPANPTLTVPVLGEIQGLLTVAPGSLQMADMKANEKQVRRAIVRGSRPFCIVGVDGLGDGLTADIPDQTAATHILTVTFQPTQAGPLRKTLTIRTDMDKEAVTVTVDGNVSP